jgi:hypothetical protein
LIDEDTLHRFLVRCTQAISPFYERAEIRLKVVSVAETFSLVSRVEQRRLKRAGDLLRSMRARGVPPYCPIALGNTADSGVWLIYPPLVEPQARRTYVINGHHRLIAARDSKIRRVQVISVESVVERAPAAGSRWADVDTTGFLSSARNARVADVKEGLVRPSASFCRSRYFYFESQEHLRDWCEWFARSADRWLWNPETQKLERVTGTSAPNADVGARQP